MGQPYSYTVQCCLHTFISTSEIVVRGLGLGGGRGTTFGDRQREWREDSEPMWSEDTILSVEEEGTCRWRGKREGGEGRVWDER